MAEQLDSAFWMTRPLTQFDFDAAKYFMFPIVAGQTHFVKNDSYVVLRPENYPGRKHGYGYFAGLLIALLLVTLATMTRLAIRLLRKKGGGWDDYLAFIAFLCSIGYYAIYMHAVLANGLGQPQRYVTYRQVIRFLEATNIGAIFFYSAVFSASMSMVMFNRRLTAQTYKKLRIALVVYAVIIVMIYLTIVIGSSLIYGANPGFYSFEYQFKHHVVSKVNASHFSRFSLFSHVAVDLSLMFVPIIIIVRTQISRSLKFRLCFIYALAIIHCSAAIVASQSNGTRKDVTYDAIHGQPMWNLIDLTSALIVVNLPVINSLLPNEFGSRSPSFMNRISQKWHSRRTPPTEIDTMSSHELTHGETEIKNDVESKGNTSDGANSPHHTKEDQPSPGL